MINRSATGAGPRKALAFTSFGRLFLGALWAVYGPHFPQEAQHESV
jgi:hypothetical protein